MITEVANSNKHANPPIVAIITGTLGTTCNIPKTPLEGNPQVIIDTHKHYYRTQVWHVCVYIAPSLEMQHRSIPHRDIHKLHVLYTCVHRNYNEKHLQYNALVQAGVLRE